jgi:enamine deaminase RidA (YjgF/YER057c/UK114 family)
MHRQVISPTSPIFAMSNGSTHFEVHSYSAAVRAGDFLFVAGQIGLDPGGTVPESAENQTKNVFERLKSILEEGGTDLAAIVELVSYHVDIQSHLPSFQKIKNRYIRAPFPTWTAVEVAGLGRPDLLIEVKAIAYAPRDVRNR